MAEWLFLAVPWGCLWFMIVVFPDHTHLLFLGSIGTNEELFKKSINRHATCLFVNVMGCTFPPQNNPKKLCSAWKTSLSFTKYFQNGSFEIE